MNSEGVREDKVMHSEGGACHQNVQMAQTDERSHHLSCHALAPIGAAIGEVIHITTHELTDAPTKHQQMILCCHVVAPIILAIVLAVAIEEVNCSWYFEWLVGIILD